MLQVLMRILPRTAAGSDPMNCQVYDDMAEIQLIELIFLQTHS